ncbi:MATE family efflux transporter [Paraglaciecola hydrolytica]|uniref:Multidrug-efflux transporter n=1 Tax=Paraglaciecola hydrolytica TaxID=1799789 RepID=A0A136A604_9ALTE|nr:MATE family efflux transporter [Paraglaciecola hydrolytica]KXI30675.1 MATE family efflux transporter [Paraglaciecola hydrolytica]
MAFKTDFKKELKTILHLAWPLLIAQITQILMGVSDTVMAGRFSATDMAAVAIGFGFTLPVIVFIQGVTLALPPIISRLNGSKKTANIANYSQQMAWLTLALSLLALAFSFVFTPLLYFIEMEHALRLITIDYVHYILLSMPAFGLYQVLRNYCEGLSITKPSMVIMGIGLLVNIPANYILIYGKFGLPQMGGAGCGLATALVFVAMFIATLCYSYFAKKLQTYQLYKQVYWPDVAALKECLVLGLPIAMTILFEVSLFAAVAILLAPFGANIVASHQVALNFSALMFMIPLSLGMATSIRVGYLLGENRPEQAKLATRCAFVIGISIALFTATFTVLARSSIARLYSIDSEVIELASSLLLLAAMFQFSDAIQVIAATALRGYKDTAWMFYLSFISYWLVGMSIGCILALTDWIVPKMAAAGFWIGFIGGLSCAAVLLGFRLKYIQSQPLRHTETAH